LPTPDLRYIPLKQIQIPRRPVRHILGDIPALAESMRDYGLQQPISVRAAGNRFLLTSGLRRVEAARRLGWTQILAFVRTVNSDDAYVLDLVENLQRQDLTAEEEADALGELVRTRGWTLQQVADAVKRSVAYVSKRVRIFEDPQLREAVVARGLPVSTAEELLAADPEQRAALIERALAEGWDQGRARVAIRAAEQALEAASKARKSGSGGQAGAAASDPSLDGMEAGASRPRGFTRAVRDFHRVIMVVRPEDLSAADRSALRSLFRDLVLLARASATPRSRIYPPLPDAG
jgi:ParB family chromosome partitioning protein